MINSQAFLHTWRKYGAMTPVALQFLSYYLFGLTAAGFVTLFFITTPCGIPIVNKDPWLWAVR